MADLDALAPNYRRARERWPDAPTLRQCHDALVACFNGNAHGLVEHVKSFIESVCVTILCEFRKPLPSSKPSTTELLVAALQPLGLQNTRGASTLNKVLSGFNRLADALTEMRNEHGPLAHGKDAFLDDVCSDHGRAFLHAGDAILGVILSALEGKEPDLLITREPYERFPHLNERIDRAVAVEARVDEDGERPVVVLAVTTGGKEEALEIRVEPSRLLYGIDRSAYIEVLKTAAETAEETTKEEELTPSVQAAYPEVVETLESPPLAEVVKGYSGRLDVLKPALEGFMIAEGWQTPPAPPEGVDLLDSLLATADHNMGLDWRSREALQARLKVACRRVLVRFGFEAKKAGDMAERLVAWLQIQAPDGSNACEVKPDGQ